jgi:hypothetical protein
MSSSDCCVAVMRVALSVITHFLYSFVIYSSFWSNTFGVLHSPWSTHTKHTILILSVTHTHTYHFIHSWTPIYYLHHKFHVLMNLRTCGVCTISTSTLVLPVVYRILKSLLQYLGVFLWILCRLLWGYTALTVSVFVFCLQFHRQHVN